MLYPKDMASRDGEDLDVVFGEGSQYGAHLDRGWALFDQGDFEAARASASQAMELRPEDPDGDMLQGAIAVASGDPIEGLRCYERAIELAPDYLEPYLSAAQLCLIELEDPNRAREFCDEATEIDLVSPVYRIDIMLLAIEAEIALGDVQIALRKLNTCSALPTLEAILDLATPPASATTDDEARRHVQAAIEAALDSPDPDRRLAADYLAVDQDGEALDDEELSERVERAASLAMRISRVRLDLGEVETARVMSERLVNRFPDAADAWHLLSEAEHRSGNVRRGALAALRTLQLDTQVELPAWLPEPPDLHAKIRSILESCPDPDVRSVLDGPTPLPILVQQLPPPELVAEGIDPRSLSVALVGRNPDAPNDPQAALLTGLAVYVNNLCRFSTNAEQFYQELRTSVLDELALFLRLSDERRNAMGLPPIPPELLAETERNEPEEPKKKKKTRRTRTRRSTTKASN